MNRKSCGRGEKRDGDGDCRNYRHEYDSYHGTARQRHNRALRNKARAELASQGRVHKGDGMEVDHKRALDKGGSNARSNLQVLTRSANRRKANK